MQQRPKPKTFFMVFIHIRIIHNILSIWSWAHWVKKKLFTPCGIPKKIVGAVGAQHPSSSLKLPKFGSEKVGGSRGGGGGMVWHEGPRTGVHRGRTLVMYNFTVISPSPRSIGPQSLRGVHLTEAWKPKSSEHLPSGLGIPLRHQIERGAKF